MPCHAMPCHAMPCHATPCLTCDKCPNEAAPAVQCTSRRFGWMRPIATHELWSILLFEQDWTMCHVKTLLWVELTNSLPGNHVTLSRCVCWGLATFGRWVVTSWMPSTNWPRNGPQIDHQGIDQKMPTGFNKIICYIDQWKPWRIRCYCLSSSWFQLPAVLWIQSLTITIIPLKCTKTPIKGKCFSNPLEQPLAEYASGQEFDGEEFKSAFAHTHLCSVFVFAHTLLFCLVFLTHLR